MKSYLKLKYIKPVIVFAARLRVPFCNDRNTYPKPRFDQIIVKNALIQSIAVRILKPRFKKK